MAIETHVRANGDWRKSKQIFIKSGGNWIDCKEVWVKEAGVWRQVFRKAFDFTYSIPVTNNFVLRTAAITAGWDGQMPLNANLTVSGVVGSSTISGYAFRTGTLPADSVVKLTINAGGYIVGAGGKGASGTGGPTTPIVKTNGQTGGTAMFIEYPMTIINNGIIGGGGGGGAGGAYIYGHGFSGFSPGGGGAGAVPGAGGDAGIFAAGHAGTLTTGGAASTSNGQTSGSGGNLGQPGNDSIYNSQKTYNMGQAGYAIQGISNISFSVTGTILGPTL